MMDIFFIEIVYYNLSLIILLDKCLEVESWSIWNK